MRKFDEIWSFIKQLKFWINLKFWGNLKFWRNLMKFEVLKIIWSFEKKMKFFHFFQFFANFWNMVTALLDWAYIFFFFQRVSKQRSYSLPLRGWSLLNVVLLVAFFSPTLIFSESRHLIVKTYFMLFCFLWQKTTITILKFWYVS